MAKAHSRKCTEVVLLIQDHGGLAWREENGLFYDTEGKPRRLGVAGRPDVLGIIPPRGRLLGVEVKVGRDKSRTGQEAWAREAEAIGAISCVAHFRDARCQAGLATVRALIETETGVRSHGH